jgi:hypothetical protein
MYFILIIVSFLLCSSFNNYVNKISIKNILSLKNKLEKSFNETNTAILEAEEALFHLKNNIDSSE